MKALSVAALCLLALAAQPGSTPRRPEGPCDIYAAAKAPCVAAHSTTRALYSTYNGPLYQVLRQSDGKTIDVGVVRPSASPVPDPGGYANAAVQDAFCANTHCWISIIYDQSPRRNHLIQAPRGGFSGPAMGGFNNLPIADMAPVTIMGHKVYGVFIAPGMGLRQNDVKGTAVDDQAEGQYWVINGHHYNSGCCFDYGNAEIDSRDDGNGTMETTYFGNATAWYRGIAPGPWIMTDQENNLVGCVNPDGSKFCANLPSINWRFVTAIAKGEPHHWTSMGGDAQRGDLKVMYDGPRIDHTYDPMRKQGAILLGNGGDNSVGSQGTFYEGAMTAGGTFPSNDTDQKIQSNVVSARYDVARVQVAPANAVANPPGLQTFAPGSSRDTTVTFTNAGSAPVTAVELSLATPRQWSVDPPSARIAEAVAPGATVSATFKVTSGPAAFNGDLIAKASWVAGGTKLMETAIEKVRNVAPVKINEFRASAGTPSNSTNSFIELYNAGTKDADISNWTLAQHQAQQAVFSAIRIPQGVKIAAGGFYLLGLSNSGLATTAREGDHTIYVRNTTGMAAGDSITVDTGTRAERRKITSIGTAAGAPTTVWQPLPDGPVIRIPAGSTNIPVTSVSGFEVGQKIAMGYGATFPNVARTLEKYEIATITAVGKPGTQAFLGADAPAGATNIKVTSVANISAGDKIRLDVDTTGHGVETVTVTRVGTQSNRTALTASANAGVTTIQVRNANGFTGGGKMTIGTPANREVVTIMNVAGTRVEFAPALTRDHLVREDVVDQGTGLDLAAPLRFNHAANLPFAARGTGISFKPATAFVHTSNEPVLSLGTGITLDQALARNHDIDAVVRDESVTTAGYQGTPAPHQWFGGPVPAPAAGAMVLRDATGLVVDSLNYGLMVDPWASEGYHGKSGAGEGGCRVAALGGFGPAAQGSALNRSAGRYPDGNDTDSNCDDFLIQVATVMPLGAEAGATNIKVASVAGFAPGQSVLVGTSTDMEPASIAAVGSAGATTASAAVNAGATSIPVASAFGFTAGLAITVDSETAVVQSVTFARGGGSITLTAPLSQAHAAGARVSGSGITLAKPVSKTLPAGAQITRSLPTPGAPNDYSRTR